MRLDTVTAEIRPRSDWEAVDLGFAMVRRDFWRCFSIWWLAVLVPTVAAGVLLWDRPVLWLLLFWWWKPAGSRMVLYQLSRRLFGEVPSWRALWREIPRAWTRRFFYRFLWARFSPWLPVTLAVEDLEGLRGKAYRQRSAQVVRRGEGVVMWIYLIADLSGAWFALGILMLAMTFIPEGQDGAWRMAVESWDISEPFDIPVLIARAVTLCMMLSISLIDLFVIGAGFGIYINNRTWIEGWDVELAFRRMARRLGKVAVMAAGFVMFAMPCVTRAADERPAEEVIREVKADPVFQVHTVTEKVPKPTSNHWNWEWPDWLKFGWIGNGEVLGRVLIVVVLGGLAILLAWIVWKFRHAFLFRGSGGAEGIPGGAKARMVMGMQVSPDSLPADVPGAAWLLWQQGRRQEAIGLLYRGTISRLIERERIEIRESDTEGDCLRRVEGAGKAGHPDYFRGITGAWVRMAYAGGIPADAEVEALCKQWPFAEGGAR